MLVLADGMGGHAAAAQAAHCAVQHFCQIAQASNGPLAERLQPALIGANAALALSAAGDPAFAGSGCTFLAVAIEDGTLSWISVGDSLLFSLRGRKLRLLNKERSRRQIVVRGKTRRKYLRSSLTGGAIGIVDRSPRPLSLRPGEQLILASDGLETLHRPMIAATLKRTEQLDVQASVDFLLREVHQAGVPLIRTTPQSFSIVGIRWRAVTSSALSSEGAKMVQLLGPVASQSQQTKACRSSASSQGCTVTAIYPWASLPSMRANIS